MSNINWKDVKYKRLFLLIYDIFAVNFSYFFVYFVTEGMPDDLVARVILQRALPMTAVFILLYKAFRVYSSMWEYAGTKELMNITEATLVGGIAGIGIDIVMSRLNFAASGLENGCFNAAFYLFGTMFVLSMVGGMRLLYRTVRRGSRQLSLERKSKLNRIMIVGAGDMGMIIISELQAGNYAKGKPVVAVDDNKMKVGKSLRGVPIKGKCEDIPDLADRYKIDTIVMCIPSADSERQNEILNIAIETGCKVKTSPTLSEMEDGDKKIKIRDVSISDLLARPEIKLDNRICSYIRDEVVLVTGGGGSIGSELCRQIAKYSPKKIIVFDIYENNAYMLKMQMEAYLEGKTEILVRIGSVRDRERLISVFEELKPTLVFHAAAHKHVPLMEDAPGEAVKNNVFGTYNVADIAVLYGVKRFVSISTDKAVNPANVMGATKRVTEMVIQYFQRKCGGSTTFAAVRFGNVLGSSGSVIPIFKQQIADGGPVTVTHPDITRYFMTIPEASQLVAQAGGLANGGEIFVLDMGEPVKILNLAENLIRLSGYKPYSEIPIEFSGLRPGEKLYEELVLEEEHNERQMTCNNKIFVTKPVQVDDNWFEEKLGELKNAGPEEVRNVLKQIVPNFVEQKYE